MMVTIQRTVYVATRRCIFADVNSVCQPCSSSAPEDGLTFFQPVHPV
jgi:hypothetical protein